MDQSLGELVGREYVARHFSPDAKQHAQSLVKNLLTAFDASIDGLDWMSPATRAAAKQKLAKITVKIGYPDVWRDYSGLSIVATDLVGNLLRVAEFEFNRQVNRIGKPVDRNEWLMTPQTVNAYYYPPRNEIVFPAAILQPPFFDPTADDAVNYGAIGGVIGHEISHGFDDSGRQFDGDGNLRDWWTFDDGVRFKRRAAALVTQYGAYSVLDGRKLNGELTLGENIGDVSGLAVAFRAYQASLQGTGAPTIDGFSGAQRFFLGWAQIWRRKYRDPELLKRLLTDPHSPSEFRANGVVGNLAAFHEAFAVQPADRLYRPAEARVRIW
jgi:predicted metalloendopeptidase